MDRILMILEDIDDSIDYSKEKKLVDDHLLDSFGIISLVGELEEEFDVSIDASEMVPQNFNSAEALWAMVQRLM